MTRRGIMGIRADQSLWHQTRPIGIALDGYPAGVMYVATAEEIAFAIRLDCRLFEARRAAGVER